MLDDLSQSSPPPPVRGHATSPSSSVAERLRWRSKRKHTDTKLNMWGREASPSDVEKLGVADTGALTSLSTRAGAASQGSSWRSRHCRHTDINAAARTTNGNGIGEVEHSADPQGSIQRSQGHGRKRKGLGRRCRSHVRKDAVRTDTHTTNGNGISGKGGGVARQGRTRSSWTCQGNRWGSWGRRHRVDTLRNRQ